MDQTSVVAAFQPKPSRQETKADATTRAAWEIIDGEASAREAKTRRLRAARLAQEEAAAKPVPAARKAKSKKV
jgi:hypothetical protein